MERSEVLTSEPGTHEISLHRIRGVGRGRRVRDARVDVDAARTTDVSVSIVQRHCQQRIVLGTVEDGRSVQCMKASSPWLLVVICKMRMSNDALLPGGVLVPLDHKQ